MTYLLAYAFIQRLLNKSLYIGMLLLLVAASLGVPLPEDIPLLFGGALCRLGYGELPIAIAIGLIGVLSGDIVLFYGGRRLGTEVLKRKPFCYLVTASHVAQMRVQFRKRGNWIIFFGRFFAGIRSVMCVTSGMCGVPAWKFILIDLSGALCSVPLLVFLGYWFSSKIDSVMHRAVSIEKIVAAIMILVLGGWFLWFHISRRHKRELAAREGAASATDLRAICSTGEENADERSEAPPV